ncbi:VC0807 family protein [Nocardia macrotermitis]|uniref:Intracellular septation protein A n=1 Tax=Nocardia macrotermitis TaxID=2585198 RepID=A0A7K0CZ39_9NOCA|nr:VC0807 family protein [Nocardia macrotermitis]MQY17924.1 hypothetical protein [Nocardia macrotermitis]
MPTPSPASGRSRALALALNWLPTLLFSMVLPFLTYSQLVSHHWSQVSALMVSGLWPLAELLVMFAIRRHLDELTLFILIFMVLGVVSYVAFNSPRMLLVKDSALTGLFGVVMLASLAAPRPLMFYWGRKFATDGSSAKVVEWNALWQYPGFRHAQRVMTVAWGLAFLGEAVLRVVLTYVVSVRTMVAINGILPVVVILLCVGWTTFYAQWSRRRNTAQTTPPAVVTGGVDADGSMVAVEGEMRIR